MPLGERAVGMSKPKANSVHERQLTERRLAYIARLAEQGENYVAVCRDMGIPVSTAWEWMRKAVQSGQLTPEQGARSGLGASRRKNRIDQAAARELVLELLIQGKSVRHAAEIAGVPYGTASDWKRRDKRTIEDRRKKEVPPDPIRYEDLADEPRSWLDDFSLFRLHILGRTWNPPWAVMTVNTLLELYFTPDDEFAVVNLAPGIGKSTLITHDFIVWATTLMRAKGLEPTILLGHRNWQKSTWYVKRCRQTFTHNRKLIWTYGRFQPTSKMAPWSTTELLVEPLNYADLGEKEPTISAGSYDASLLSGRFKLVIWDDLIDKANASSNDQREALVVWWQQEAETRLEPGGLLVLSNARYGPEDLSWFVCTQTDPDEVNEAGEEKPLYTRIRYPVHFDELCNGTDHTGPWPDGCLLDPVRASYKRIRRFMVQSAGRFRLVWQQEDTDPAGNLAQKAWFTGGTDSYDAEAPGCFRPDLMFGQRPNNDAPLLSAVSVDPSGVKRWAAAHYLSYPDGIDHVLRAVNRPMQAPDLLYRQQDGQFTGLLEDWWIASSEQSVPFTYLIVEQNAAQRYLMQYEFFRTWCSTRGVALIPHSTNRSNKPDPDRGLEMLGPVYRFGRLQIPYMGYHEKLLGDAWMREACAWPEGSSDDLLLQHWFFRFRREQLVVTELSDNDRDEFDESLPRVVRERMGTPRWARRHLDGRDRVGA